MRQYAELTPPSGGDVAGVAAFLASSDADYITGTTVIVDGGLLWNYSEQ